MTTITEGSAPVIAELFKNVADPERPDKKLMAYAWSEVKKGESIYMVRVVWGNKFAKRSKSVSTFEQAARLLTILVESA